MIDTRLFFQMRIERIRTCSNQSVESIARLKDMYNPFVKFNCFHYRQAFGILSNFPWFESKHGMHSSQYRGNYEFAESDAEPQLRNIVNQLSSRISNRELIQLLKVTIARVH